MTDSIPKVIGRYEIRKELGRGTMGVVYEAVDSALGRTIALKTIQISYAISPEEREAFEKRFVIEARVAARLSHPNIVMVHDIGRDAESGIPFIALEHLRGRTLADLAADGAPLEWREALRITARLAEALHHAHTQGIVHRDIKPANIMLLASGEPKVMDFGIAKVPASHLTVAGQVFGTPSYMSPEQALGGLVDSRSDLFSLGTVLYQLLTGRKAFGADSVPRIVALVARHDPLPPSRVVRTLPPEADYLAARALAKAPVDRYPDGRTMAEDLEDVLAGEPPRHRGSWKLPRRAEGTLVSMPLVAPEDPLSSILDASPPPPDTKAEIEAEIDTLLSALTGPAEAPAAERPRTGEPAPARVPAATMPRGGGAARLVPPRPGGRRAARLLFLAFGFGLLVAVTFLWRLEQPADTPPATPATPAAPMATESPLAPPNATVASPEVPPPAQPPATPEAATDEPAALAQLALDFEHPLRSGTLRVFVDDRLVLEQDLAGRVARKVIGIKIRKGRVEDVLSVSPGKHQVRVQVAWDDKLKEEALWGTLKAGSVRRLVIRLGRIRKNLSLEWR